MTSVTRSASRRVQDEILVLIDDRPVTTLIPEDLDATTQARGVGEPTVGDVSFRGVGDLGAQLKELCSKISGHPKTPAGRGGCKRRTHQRWCPPCLQGGFGLEEKRIRGEIASLATLGPEQKQVSAAAQPDCLWRSCRACVAAGGDLCTQGSAGVGAGAYPRAYRGDSRCDCNSEPAAVRGGLAQLLSFRT